MDRYVDGCGLNRRMEEVQRDDQRSGQMDTEVMMVWLGGQNGVWMEQCLRMCLDGEF